MPTATCLASDVEFRAGGISHRITPSATDLSDVYRTYTEIVQPYTLGNIHPGFMGWVQGGGTVVGMLSEMLIGGLNANLGGRDQSPSKWKRKLLIG